MYSMLLWLYEGGKLTVELLANVAVIKGYITDTQKQEILAT